MSEHLQNLDFLDIEVSTACNANCLDCCRNEIIDGVIYNNPWHPYLNKHYQLQDFRNHINQFSNTTPNFVVLCGNSGDPMSNPDIAEIVVALRNTFPHSTLEIETNGSLGKLETFEKIAEQNCRIRFHLDGLEDTLHVYRKNVKYQSVMRNALHFISHKGEAIWDTIDFPHTAHQVDEMKSMADRLGFSDFHITHRFHPEHDEMIVKTQNIKPQSISHVEVDTPNFVVSDKWFENNKIQPKCRENTHITELYIESNGTVWPCCTIAQIQFRKMDSDHKKWIEMNKKYGKNWNSLYHHDLDDILASSFFSKDLPSSWTNQQLLEYCKNKCGQCIIS
jgi:MoaA/NifB/PqqE/SkfB family radical SAM enzyme